MNRAAAANSCGAGPRGMEAPRGAWTPLLGFGSAGSEAEGDRRIETGRRRGAGGGLALVSYRRIFYTTSIWGHPER